MVSSDLKKGGLKSLASLNIRMPPPQWGNATSHSEVGPFGGEFFKEGDVK